MNAKLILTKEHESHGEAGRRFGMSAEPFAAADLANASGAVRAAIVGVQREREARRDTQPLPAGSLFDEVRRNTQELF